jgi:hypothetical protein
MSDRMQPLFAQRLRHEPEVTDAAEPESSVSAFGYLRGVRDRAQMLELRKKDGSSVAFAYTMLDRASFDPSDGIRLSFPGTKIHLVGQRLNDPVDRGLRLYELLLRHRVTWIQEASRADTFEAHNSVVVESILID